MVLLTSDLCPLSSDLWKAASRRLQNDWRTLMLLLTSDLRPLTSGKQRRAAFTLVELLTVIAIIAILAGLILGVSGYATRKADTSHAIADMEKIKGALDEYRLQYGSYPSSITAADVRKKLTNEMQNAVTDLNFKDPWDRDYRYSKSSTFNYTLSSSGPDSQPSATEDDIDSSKVGM